MKPTKLIHFVTLASIGLFPCASARVGMVTVAGILTIPEAQATSTSESKGGKPGEACTETCAAYQTGDTGLLTICGEDTTSEEYAACKTLFDSNSAYCQTIILTQQAYDMGMTSAIAYTGVAAICTSACICQMTPWSELVCGITGTAACALGGVGASGADFAMNQQQQSTATEWVDTWSKTSFGLGAAGGGAALIAGAAGLTKGAKDVAGTAQAAKDATEAANAAQKAADAAKGTAEAADAAAKAADAAKAAEEAAKTADAAKSSTGNTVQDLAVCVSAGLYAASATTKWLARGYAKKSGDEACNAIIAQAGPDGVSYGSTAVPTGSGGDTSTAGDTTTSDVAATDPATTAETALTAPSTSAAKAGGIGKIPGRESIPETLKKMGTSIGDIGKKLRSQSPAMAIAGLPGMSPMTAALTDLDARSKKLAADSGGAYASGGRGSQGGGKPNNAFGLFGTAGNGISAGPKDLSFAGEKRAPSSLGSAGDIWHSGANVTIFEIVTSKIVASRDRIDLLQWASPLNRAMHGLAQQPKKRQPATGGKAKPAPAQILDRKSRTF